MIQEAWSSAHTQYSDWLYVARYVGIYTFGHRAYHPDWECNVRVPFLVR